MKDLQEMEIFVNKCRKLELLIQNLAQAPLLLRNLTYTISCNMFETKECYNK